MAQMRQTHFSRRGPHSTSPLQPGRFQIGTRSPHTDSTDTRPRRLALPPPLLTSGHDCGVRGGWDPIPDVDSPDYRVMSARWCSRGGRGSKQGRVSAVCGVDPARPFPTQLQCRVLSGPVNWSGVARTESHHEASKFEAPRRTNSVRNFDLNDSLIDVINSVCEECDCSNTALHLDAQILCFTTPWGTRVLPRQFHLDTSRSAQQIYWIEQPIREQKSHEE
ncbi:hypothetical protein Bbelb_027360 [Branchiostoma belcheri]|nr:hypothetical protein Bbelb_027360 [Branchiostoma belcheri]